MNSIAMPANPDVSSRQGSIIALFVVMLLLAATVVVLRFYTRWKLLHMFDADDWLIGVALVHLVVSHQ